MGAFGQLYFFYFFYYVYPRWCLEYSLYTIHSKMVYPSPLQSSSPSPVLAVFHNISKSWRSLLWNGVRSRLFVSQYYLEANLLIYSQLFDQSVMRKCSWHSYLPWPRPYYHITQPRESNSYSREPLQCKWHSNMIMCVNCEHR